MLKKILLLCFALAVSFSGAVNAGAKDKKHEEYYLDLAAQTTSQIAAAPAEGSEQDKKDLALLREWQAKRTPEECERAKGETSAAYSEMFGTISPLPLPLPKKAAAILKKVKKDTDRTVDSIKKFYGRKRPFNRDAELKPCIDPAKGNIGPLAYPSGHATIARVYALLLSDLVPEQKDAYLAKADEAALNRVLSGVHHPSDIEAGKRPADSIYAQFKKNPAFQKDLEKLRALLKVPARI
jgi:acid phosphatase (class A)